MRRHYTISTTVVGAIPVAAQETVIDVSELERLTFGHWMLSHDVPIEASVATVEFTVLPNGTTEDVVVVKSEPSNDFGRSVVAAVTTWRYKPIERAVRITQRIEIKDVSLE